MEIATTPSIVAEGAWQTLSIEDVFDSFGGSVEPYFDLYHDILKQIRVLFPADSDDRKHGVRIEYRHTGEPRVTHLRLSVMFQGQLVFKAAWSPTAGDSYVPMALDAHASDRTMVPEAACKRLAALVARENEYQQQLVGRSTFKKGKMQQAQKEILQAISGLEDPRDCKRWPATIDQFVQNAHKKKTVRAQPADVLLKFLEIFCWAQFQLRRELYEMEHPLASPSQS